MPIPVFYRFSARAVHPGISITRICSSSAQRLDGREGPLPSRGAISPGRELKPANTAARPFNPAKLLESVRRQRGVDGRAGDRAMPQPALDRPGVVSIVGERQTRRSRTDEIVGRNMQIVGLTSGLCLSVPAKASDRHACHRYPTGTLSNCVSRTGRSQRPKQTTWRPPRMRGQ
jgi:hypothetical protein